jgi:hypothetical protein
MRSPRTIWKNDFTSENIPNWICPHCSLGILEAGKTDFNIIETEASKRAKKEVEWEPEWINGNFTGILKCSSNKCAEMTIVCGEMSVAYGIAYDEMGNQEYPYSEELSPLLFVPALKIIELDANYPEIIETAIIESFKLFWIDSSSCCNKIRIVIELIMNDQKIPKITTSGKKRRKYSLHERIELFGKKSKDESEQLMAIKWIGNSGSHADEKNTKDDALDAYEILEHVLSKLYHSTTHIVKLSKSINRRKKPNSIKRKKKGIWGTPNKKK